MARMVDGDKIVESLSLIAKCWSVSPFVSKEKHLGAVSMLREVEREVKEAPTLTQPNVWVSTKIQMPTEHEPVLCIVSGWPKPNIMLEDAYQLGSWNKADGWIIDEYPDWEDADVSWWMPLPASPDKDNNVPAKTPNEPLTLEHLRASPHGKIKDSTLQSICNRANEIACRPPEG